jgi:hypothetical protein
MKLRSDSKKAVTCLHCENRRQLSTTQYIHGNLGPNPSFLFLQHARPIVRSVALDKLVDTFFVSFGVDAPRLAPFAWLKVEHATNDLGGKVPGEQAV